MFIDKSSTYFHPASGTLTSIYLDFSWKVGSDPCGSNHFAIILENGGPPSLQRVQRWKLTKTNWEQFQHLCSTRLHQSAITDAHDPISLFTFRLAGHFRENYSLDFGSTKTFL